jgi:hypothetical protein
MQGNERPLTYTAYFPPNTDKPSIAIGPDPASCGPNPDFCVRVARGLDGDGHKLATVGTSTSTTPVPAAPTPTDTGPVNRRPSHVSTPGFVQSPSGNIECQLSPPPVLCTVESLRSR